MRLHSIRCLLLRLQEDDLFEGTGQEQINWGKTDIAPCVKLPMWYLFITPPINTAKAGIAQANVTGEGLLALADPRTRRWDGCLARRRTLTALQCPVPLTERQGPRSDDRSPLFAAGLSGDFKLQVLRRERLFEPPI